MRLNQKEPDAPLMYGSAMKEKTLKPGSVAAFILSLQEIVGGKSQASSEWGRDEEQFVRLSFT